MLNRWRLPPDDFPDETETNAFQNYRDDQGQFGEVFSLLFGSRQRILITAGVFVGIVAVIWLGLYMVLPTPTKEVVVTPDGGSVAEETIIPSPVLAEAVGGEFPAGVPQEVISIPARIDDSLAFGSRMGYAFHAEAGLTWQITVFGATGFDPVISLYGPPSGQLLANNDDRGVGDLASEITVTFQQDGNYAVLLEGSGGASGGGYTLLIVPIE
jgi:hypothetical protein